TTHIWGFENKQDDGAANLDLHVGDTESVNVQLDAGETVDNIIKGVLQLLAGQEPSNSSGTKHDNEPVDTKQMATRLWEGQSIDYYGTPIDCQSLSDSNSDGSKRKACRDAVLKKLQDNAPPNSEVTGLLPGVVSLLDGVVGSLGDILDGLLGGLFGNGC